MNQTKTICYQIERSFDILKTAVETGDLDTPTLSKHLHSIRLSAQKMEEAIKLRKKLMIKHEIEDEYQSSKGVPPTRGTNNIKDDKEERSPETQDFHVTVKHGEEVMYDAIVHAGVISFVETVTGVDEDGFINGSTQKLAFGHNMAIFYALDQLNQGLEDRRMGILTELQAMSKDGKLNEEARQLLEERLKEMNIEEN